MKYIFLLLIIIVLISACIQQQNQTQSTIAMNNTLLSDEINNLDNFLNENEEFLNNSLNTEINLEVGLI